MSAETLEFLGQPSVAVAVGAAAIGAVAAAYLFGGDPAPSSKVFLSSVIADQSKEAQGGGRVCCLAKDHRSETQFLDETMGPSVRTMLDIFNNGLNESRNQPCVGQCKAGKDGKPYYDWTTYQEIYDMARKCGSGLKTKGIARQQMVGIYSQNRTEWCVSELACYQYSLVPVPLYDTLGPDSCTYIINKTDMKLVICDTEAKASALVKDHAKHPVLKTIVICNPPSDDCRAAATSAGVDLLTFDDLLELGAQNMQSIDAPKPDDMSIICFTSGTTGDPKGVVLSHLSVVSDLGAAQFQTQDVYQFTSSMVTISYLPLAHMFERMSQYSTFCVGGRVGIFRGDIRKLTEDIQALRPTVMAIVPRLLNRLVDKVEAGVKGSAIKEWLLRTAVAKKVALLKRGIITKDSIWDKLVFKKVQAIMGGRVAMMTTGSAPLDPKVMEFARVAFGCTLMEGYGQTEGVAGLTLQFPGDFTPGSVGAPMACNRIKLVDVPDMQYWASEGKGEVCAKGLNVCTAYYKEPGKTAETIDADGWLHTGDVGMWLPNGALKIIDRKKHIFKLAQGEYIAPEKLENVYVRSSPVAQCFVEGDSLKPCTVAIVGPDLEVFEGWCKDQGFSGSLEQLCQNKDVQKAVLKDMNAVGAKMGLKSLEQVKAVTLFPEQFSVENGLLTPTLKTKRPALRKLFAGAVADMYKALGH